MLGARLRECGLSTASLWASVPSYISSAPSPKAALALVEKISVVLGVPLPRTDLEIASEAYVAQISELVAEAEEDGIPELVQAFEEDYDEQGGPDRGNDRLRGVDASDVASIADDPEALVAEVEDFLRNHPD